MAVKALMTDETGKQIVDAIREKAGLEERVSDLEKNKVDKSSIAQTTGTAEDKVISQRAVTEELEKKFDKSNVVQSTGDAEDKVMSQAAATKEFGKLSEDKVDKWENVDTTIFVDGFIRLSDGTLRPSEVSRVYKIVNKSYGKIKAYVATTATEVMAIAFYNTHDVSMDGFIADKSVQFTMDAFRTGYWYEAEVPSDCKLICITTINPTDTFEPLAMYTIDTMIRKVCSDLYGILIEENEKWG